MTLSLKHAFHSAKSDGTDATKVQPSNWNAEHALTLAADRLVGRDSSGPGDAQEIVCTALARSILAAVDEGTLKDIIGVASTGDAKLTLKTSADTGWVMMDDGTIGDVGSGATTRANADTQALFTLLYNVISDANAVLYTSGGIIVTRASQSNAATAWAAKCRISLNKQLGRAFIAAGAGSGLTSRSLGAYFGEETHQLTVAELAQHSHGVTDNGHTHPAAPGQNFVSTTTSTGLYNVGNAPLGGSAQGSTGSADTGISIQNQGSNTPHNNMQPSSAWNVMLKL